MSFYNAYARSVICYGLLIYGSAAKTKLEKNELGHRSLIRAILFKKKYDSLQDVLRQTDLNTVFELFIVDVLRQIFNQLRSNATTKISKLVVETIHQKREDGKRDLGNTIEPSKK